MQKIVAGIVTGLGVLAIVGTLLWSWAGAGIFGSPFSGMRAEEVRNVILLLVIGPITLLPAGLVGRTRPLTAGFWLIASAIFCFFWHLGVVEHEGFDQLFRSFEAWLPVTLICGPMVLSGLAFLWAGRSTALAAWQSPCFRRWCVVVGGTLAAAAAVMGLIFLATRPVWTLTVTPKGGETRTVRFDPRKWLGREKEMEAAFAGLFDRAERSGRTILGTSSLTGPMLSGKTSTWVAERNEQGLLLILENTDPVDRNWMTDQAALSNAGRRAVGRILEQCWRNYPQEQR